ncbi:3-oxoacyl-[acyl-carrier-protein] synthase 3 protein 1 [Catellatospora methionotrophica]|uniref:Beta-ketoacyl-[acyl-carrier-protein] synthase III n=1 Tax=Catellatospora methionotrophica TaxID=121620 RepID=A0A8J3PCU5_9ACTN|nr:beta-ketoacyl-ACP synthase III [Catellatospora methionotrophica]GIG11718.1 3-oxoacyl-[acyl-carrier-protein] synthase 3 protein 1 [Catellatospora methionotrophica]
MPSQTPTETIPNEPAPTPAAIAVAGRSPYAQILGLGAYRPRRVVTNDELCTWVDTSDEWIRARTGITQRRWAEPDETLAAMSVQAATAALADAGITAADIGCVVMATVTHLEQTPSIAALIAHQLGAVNAAAFDISAGCAGFCHAVALGRDMVQGGSAGHVLVIGAEKISDFIDRQDRTTAFIFGDGAGAVVIGPASRPGIGPVVWGADGSQYTVIGQTRDWKTFMDDPTGPRPFIQMSGQQVFRWASYEMVPVANKALQAAGITVDQLDAFIPHQANMRIIDAMVKALKLPDSLPVARDIAEMGNTSAASVPLAMERMRRDGAVPAGGTALLVGFGAGLSYAAQVVRLPWS